MILSSDGFGSPIAGYGFHVAYHMTHYILWWYAARRDKLSPGSTIMNKTWASTVKQANKYGIVSTTSLTPHSSTVASNREQSLKTYKKDGTSVISLLSNTAAATEEEVVSNKKTRKKKKNKQNTNSIRQEAQTTPNETIFIQEPPRIEDDEEFPDLASSLAGTGSGLRHEPFKSLIYSQSMSLGTAVKPKGSGKKSKVPVQLDLGGMVAALEQKQHAEKTKQCSKPLVFSVGGGIPVLSREPVPPTKPQQSKSGLAPHNPLDSSAPLVKKGKQREVPKAKKPTSLKKIILKEREQRKQLRSMTQEAIAPGESDSNGSSEKSSTNQTGSTDLNISPGTVENAKGLTDTTMVVHGRPMDTTSDLPPLPEANSKVARIHSRRFREYCSQVLSKEVDKCVTGLLKELVRFQDRMYQKDPGKAKTKRRLVMGLREVLKHLKLGKLKCIIISPNCEKIQSKGGLDDTLQTIIDCAQEQNVPCVFALNRKALGRCVNKAVPVSVVGIFSYDGAQDYFHKLCELTSEARKIYEEVSVEIEQQPGNWMWVNKHESDQESQAIHEGKSEEPDEVSTQSTAAEEEDDEPHYIKVWRQMMINDGCSPYNMSFEDKVITNLFNIHL
ncbi:selenocysteine insertion sequence-binding protein 2 [Pelodytes ibericus]